MKIIEEGVLPPKPVYRGRCLNCNCLFEVDEDDEDITTLAPPPMPKYTPPKYKHLSGKKEYRCPTVGCGKSVDLQTYSLATEKA